MDIRNGSSLPINGLPHLGLPPKPSFLQNNTPSIPSTKRSLPLEDESVKRHKINPSIKLPSLIWQRVFSFLDPMSLCRLCRVNKKFRACLADADAGLLDPETIWSQSRKQFAPTLPSPLPGKAEREMLSLVTQTHCEGCVRPSYRRSNLANTFSAGPGSHNVRIIWPFGMRLCGNCLTGSTIKDTDLLVSPVAHLRPGLTYVFKAAGDHYVPPWQVETKTRPTITLYKVYHLRLLELLRQELESVRHVTPQLVSDWLSSLPQRAKSLREQSQNWHSWEASINPSVSLAQAVRDSCRPASHSLQSIAPRVPIPLPAAPPLPSHFPTSLPNAQSFYKPPPLPNYMPNAPGIAPGLSPAPQYRSAETVQAAKDARRVEIERRCLIDMNPPVLPDVLQQMTSFQAAVQIPEPLTDYTWELLKPRLIAQREEAEELEYRRMTTASAIQSTFAASVHRNNKNAKTEDRERIEYENSQSAIRDLLKTIADRYIAERWNGGKNVTFANVPDFAADVLVVVRARYAKAIEDKKADLSDPRWFLNLDSMKWVYEDKIKPIASRFSLELFVCGICEDSRYYAFEGMVQHAGAKHNEDYGENNVIVQWRKAEWPDDPPFMYKPLESQPEAASADTGTSLNIDSMAAASLLPALLRAIPHTTTPVPDDKEVSRLSDTDTYNLDLIASTAQVYWSSLADVLGLWNSVRLTAALYYAVKMYEQQQGKTIDLDTLADALRRPSVKDILAINDLACQTCVSSNLGSAEQIPRYEDRVRGSQFSSPLALIEHYKVVHRSGSPESSAWLTEMIEVPDDQDIRGLMTAVGMNDSKLAIIGGAFSRIFPPPLPRIGTVTAAILHSKIAHASQKQRKKPQGRDKKRRDHSERLMSLEVEDASYESLPEAGDDEYDPRRPRFASNRANQQASKHDHDRSPQPRRREPRAKQPDKEDPYAREIPDFIRSSDLPADPVPVSNAPVQHAYYPYSQGPSANPDIAGQSSYSNQAYTPGYAQQPQQPQQQSQAATITRMPDLYSYGGVMYHMVTSTDANGQQTSWLEPAQQQIDRQAASVSLPPTQQSFSGIAHVSPTARGQYHFNQ